MASTHAPSTPADPIDDAKASADGMSPGRVRLSVVIRARNAEHDLGELLPVLRAQQGVGPLQIVLVDNESTDGSCAVAAGHGVEIVGLPDSSWSWGHALNLGFEHAGGELVVVLSADACPIGDRWLEETIRHFDDPGLAAIYGRQRPRPDAPLDEWCRVDETFPATSRRWGPEDARGDRIEGLIASNSCAVYRRTDWERTPFEVGVPAEERGWCLATLRAGRSIVYMASPEVHHSHFEPRRRRALRILDVSTRGARPSRRAVIRMAARLALKRLAHLGRRGAGLDRRMRGLFSLPGDTAAIVSMGWRLASGMSPEEARRRWW